MTKQFRKKEKQMNGKVCCERKKIVQNWITIFGWLLKRRNIFFSLSFCLFIVCENPPMNNIGRGELLVGTGVFGSVGQLAVIDIRNGNTATKNVLTIPQDHKLGEIDGKAFVLGRSGSHSIIALDENNGYSLAFNKSLRNTDNGQTPNPSDLAKIDASTGVVAFYDVNRLSFFDVTTGDITGSIIIPSAGIGNTGTSKYEAVSLHRHGNYVYVALQDINENENLFNNPHLYYNQVGKILKLNVNTRMFEGNPKEIKNSTQECRNPQYDFTEYNGNIDGTGVKDWLIIACVGEYVFNRNSHDVPSSLWAYDIAGDSFRQILTENATTGSMAEVLIVSDSLAFARRSDFGGGATLTPSGFSLLLRFNPLTGSDVFVVPGIGSGGLGERMRYKAGKLYVTDRTNTKPGVRIFNIDSSTQTVTKETSDPIDVGLPPNALLFR